MDLLEACHSQRKALISYISMNKTLIAFSLLSSALFASDPLQDTIKILTNSTLRQKEGLTTPEARAADAQAGDLVGTLENKEKLYELASSILETLVTEANGDPDKLQKLVEGLQKDPKSLEGKLSPQQRENLRQLAGNIEKSKAH